MFDLETSIVNWKRWLQQSGSIGHERLEELESHLRDAIDDLKRRGLNAEESFLVSAKRLGQATELAIEYDKNGVLGVNHAPVVWMLTGYLGMTLCAMLSTTLVSTLSAALGYAGVGATTTGVAATLLQLVFWAAVLVAAWRMGRAPIAPRGFSMIALAFLFLVMIILPLASLLANSAQATVVEVTWAAQTYQWIGFGHFAIQLMIYAVCFAAIYTLRPCEQAISSETQ